MPEAGLLMRDVKLEESDYGVISVSLRFIPNFGASPADVRKS